MTADRCVIATTRGWDPETDEWVYRAECLRDDHAERTCPAEHEVCRWPRGGVG